MPDDTASETCLVDAPAPGLVQVTQWCDRAQTPGSGEGGAGDLVLSNAWFRAIIRQPAHALTIPGVGGGTLVDAAPWGFRDRLYEAIPLVGMAAIQPESWEVLEDGLRVTGPLRPLDGEPSTEERASVTWRILPDRPRLSLEGATGLWLHTTSEQTPRAGSAEGPAVSLVTDGTITDDAGGAFIIDGLSFIEVWRTDERWQDAPGSKRVTGVASGATSLHMRAKGAERGSILLLDEQLDLFVPEEVDEVRGEAPDRAPSAWRTPGLDLDLSVGAPGFVQIQRGNTELAPVQWRAEGRGGIVAVSSSTTVETGAGEVQLTSRGVTDLLESSLITVPADATVSTRLTSGEPAAQGWVTLGTLMSERDLRTRRSSTTSVAEAWLEGTDAVVLLSTNGVAERLETDIPVFPGSELASRDGWRVAAFPWYPDPRFSARGALDPSLLTPEQAPAAMRGGPSTARTTIADYAWLQRAETPETWPDAIRLPAPGPAPLATWGRWLALERPPRPFGPVTRVRVSDPENWGLLDIQRGLASGLVVAGTGPHMEVLVDEQASAVLPEGDYQLRGLVQRPGGLDHLALVTPEGILYQWSRPFPREFLIDLDVDQFTWIGWSEDATEWMATQHFLRPPPP